MSSTERHNAKQRENRVARAYGGSRCHKCVRTRIMRSFLVEEQIIVKAMQKTALPKKEAATEAAEDKSKKSADKKKPVKGGKAKKAATSTKK